MVPIALQAIKMISKRRSFHDWVTLIGFTLLELLLVVMVLGIITALVAPTFSKSLANFKVESTAYTLLNWMKYAQEKAVMTGKQQKLTIQNNGVLWEYWIEGERRKIEIPTDLNVSGSGDTFSLEFTFARDSSISQGEVVIEDPNRGFSKKVTTLNGFGRIEIE